MNIKFLEKYFEDSDLKRYRSQAKAIINYQARNLKKVSDAGLAQKTIEFRQRFNNGEALDKMVIEIYAVVRELAWRKVGLSAREVQLMAALGAFEGKIVEMKTGEGKTLTIAFPTYIRAIPGLGVHVVTTNDYLAKRDTEWIGQVYSGLGMSVSCLQARKSYVMKDTNLLVDQQNVDEEKLNEEISSGQVDELSALDPSAHRYKTDTGDVANVVRKSFNSSFLMKEPPKYSLIASSRQEAYLADITYGTNHEFGFDYLRDNMALETRQIRRKRPLYFAIIDEVDSILIDEAQTPLVISRDKETAADLFLKFNQVILQLQPEDYVVEEKNKISYFTQPGIDKIEKILNIELYGKNGVDYAFHAEMALRAHLLFNKDKDYIVHENKVYIIDEFTGRMMKGHKYAEGVHQAIEAKEGLLPGAEAVSLALITYQSFFKLYTDFTGLTGTGIDAAKEFKETYNKEVVAIPTHKFTKREDKPDLFYDSTENKISGLVNQVKDLHQQGRPVLLGTHSVQESEIVVQLLKAEGIDAQVLNAKNNEKEAQIVSEAGKKGHITVSTNMAGRGTDIKIDEEVAHLGGLEVIATGRAASRRVDNQLVGRAGRQGDRGGSQFHISIEDDLFRFYLPPHLRRKYQEIPWQANIGTQDSALDEGLQITQSIASSIAEEQRKHVYQQDQVLDFIRRKFYSMRRKILIDDDLGPELRAIFDKQITKKVIDNCSLRNKKKWKPEAIVEDLQSFMGIDVAKSFDVSKYPYPKRKELDQALSNFVITRYQEITQLLPPEEKLHLERKTMLEILDALWVDYLKSIKYLDEILAFITFGTSSTILEFRIQTDKIYRRLENISGDMIMKILFISILKSRQGEKIEENVMQVQKSEDLEFKTK